MTVDDLEINIDDSKRELTISGEYKCEDSDELTTAERPTGGFTRCIPLPSDSGLEDVEAEAQNGLLRVRVPRVHRPGKKIAVKKN